jgi:thioredoxin 1
MTSSNQTPSPSKPGSALGAVIVLGVLALVALIIFGQNQGPASGAICPEPAPGSSAEQGAAENVQDATQPVPEQQPPTPVDQPAETVQNTPPPETVQNDPPPEGALPRLVDLGTLSCQPCKMMVPVLEELRQKYSGKMQVDFINVAEDRAAGSQYRVRVIPLQIFFDASGKELFRHEGYWPTADIVAKWKELGFDFQ